MLNGDRVNQMKRWITNRLAYLDSKYDYNTDEKSIIARFDIHKYRTVSIFKLRHQFTNGLLLN